MRAKNQESKSIGLGILFIILVVFVLIISIFVKLIDVLGRSEFDGKTNFNILYAQSKGWESISLSPSSHSISLISLNNKISPASLGIPYDISFKNDSKITPDNAKSQIIPLLISAHANPFDLAKIFLFLKSVDNDSVQSENISSSDFDPKNILQIYSDPGIATENLNVEISNATGESGVGSYFAKVISNIGGNVVLVSTSADTLDKSQILSDVLSSQTVKKISEMYGIKPEKKTPELSDVKIVIGKDLLSKIK